MTIASCIGCGCDDDHACHGGCSWLRVDYSAELGVCSSCRPDAERWDAGDRAKLGQPIASAPLDGTMIELLVRHHNFRFCQTAREGELWRGWHRGHWIAFNGGGWTWSGLAGEIVGWRP